MTKTEFIEKWQNELNTSSSFSVIITAFKEDVWSLGYEEKTQSTLDSFLNKWIRRIYNNGHFEEFRDDVFKLIAEKNQEAVKEYSRQMKENGLLKDEEKEENLWEPNNVLEKFPIMVTGLYGKPEHLYSLRGDDVEPMF